MEKKRNKRKIERRKSWVNFIRNNLYGDKNKFDFIKKTIKKLIINSKLKRNFPTSESLITMTNTYKPNMRIDTSDKDA